MDKIKELELQIRIMANTINTLEMTITELKRQRIANMPVMPSLPLDIIDFIGRCNLYQENGKWYNEDGLFANSDVSLLQYIIELNGKMNVLGNEA